MTLSSLPDPHTRSQSEARLQKRAFAVWFVGLPCSGKTTLAIALQQKLNEQNLATEILDGDVLRKETNKDLGYSLNDRAENIRRAASASKILIDNGVITLNSFITPTKALRQLAREIIGDKNFIEVFVKCPLELCEQRDVKGLYKKARAGEIKDFTGVSSIFEEPTNADVVIDTSTFSVEECVDDLLNIIMPRINIRG